MFKKIIALVMMVATVATLASCSIGDPVIGTWYFWGSKDNGYTVTFKIDNTATFNTVEDGEITNTTTGSWTKEEDCYALGDYHFIINEENNVMYLEEFPLIIFTKEAINFEEDSESTAEKEFEVMHIDGSIDTYDNYEDYVNDNWQVNNNYYDNSSYSSLISNVEITKTWREYDIVYAQIYNGNNVAVDVEAMCDDGCYTDESYAYNVQPGRYENLMFYTDGGFGKATITITEVTETY